MSAKITLPVWPTTLDCLRWSQDNVIAMAGGEHVAIVVPLLREWGQSRISWETAIIRTNAFTNDEIPLEEPLSRKNFAPGEEISLRHVQSLEWSPPGIARFSKCALAVLTSNFVLSIWEPDGKLEVGENWKRRFIVNKVLRARYANLEKGEAESNRDFRERKQVAQRVRSFVWGLSPQAPASAEYGSSGFYDCQLLALSTEAGEVLLLHVRSPYNSLDCETSQWRAEVVGSFDVASTVRTTPPSDEKPNGIDDHSDVNNICIAEHLAWGPWKSQGSGEQSSKLAFVADGRAVCIQIQARDVDGALTVDLLTKEGCALRTEAGLPATGPLSFVPKSQLLIAFATDQILCIDTADDALITQTFHHLDGRWDEISGVAFTSNGWEVAQANVVSHLSSATAPTAALKLPLNEDSVARPPWWQDAINESKAAYSSHHNLEGNVLERTCGIASSPMGGYVATASFNLPSDQISYTIPSLSESTIIFSGEPGAPQDDILPDDGGNSHPCDVTMETLLFYLCTYLERPSAEAEPEKLVGMALDWVDASRKTPETWTWLESPGSLTPLQAMHFLRSELMFAEMQKERLKLVASAALDSPLNTTAIRMLVLPKLVQGVLSISQTFEQGGLLSSTIRGVYESLKRKLDSLPSERPACDAVSPETCDICRKDIAFESVNWAKCGGGHQFKRCGLTFLAIQGPGLTKGCGVCGAKFLNEWKQRGFADGDNTVMTEFPDLETEDSKEVDMTNAPEVRDEVGKVDLAGLPAAKDHQPLGTEAPDVGDEASEAVSTTDFPGAKGNQSLAREQSSGNNMATRPNSAQGRVDVSHGGAREPPSSLARILFAAIDRCIYCGGKFAV